MLLADLLNHPPAAVVVVRDLNCRGSVVSIDRERGEVVLRIALDRFGDDPRFRAWLESSGYRLVRSNNEYQLYVSSG